MKWFVIATVALISLESLSCSNAFLVPQTKSKTSLLSSSRLFSTTVQEKATKSSSKSTVYKTVSGQNINEKEEDTTSSTSTTWQDDLEELLDPTTPLGRRQILVSELASETEDIRNSVQEALRDRNIDPILTPTGKRLQDGTRAVARQITNDILPRVSAAASSGRPPLPNPPADLPTLLPKVGSRMLNAISNQAKKNLELLQGDLIDPTRIPKRIEEQTTTLVSEARNVFRETPEGLVGPSYKVVSKGEGYEIRDYEGYTVASTNMATVGEQYTMDDIASGGAAFNTLASYLFGANDQGKTMEMTTPVTTTSLGEMRFYLKKDDNTEEDIPNPTQPEEQDDGFLSYEKGAVQIHDVPPARLAVLKFSGFVTDGEVQRQKDTLLSRLALDGIEIDVPHGSVVPHVVFQYNPPYTLPIVRRNEIAIPVRDSDSDKEEDGTVSAADLETEWKN